VCGPLADSVELGQRLDDLPVVHSNESPRRDATTPKRLGHPAKCLYLLPGEPRGTECLIGQCEERSRAGESTLSEGSHAPSDGCCSGARELLVNDCLRQGGIGITAPPQATGSQPADPSAKSRILLA
jgi:hypothetical protein